MSSNFSKKPTVKLIAVTKGVDDKKLGPEEISAVGALGCFDEKSSWNIWKELKNITPEKRRRKIQGVLRESAGRGHGSVLDQNDFIYSIEDLTRAATLFLCGPEYLAHEQQSLRRATADRGFYIPDNFEGKSFKETVDTLYGSFVFYNEAVEKGVPKEDARNPLPLYTKTNIQTKGNARELMHLRKMTKHEGVPSSVGWTIEEMLDQAETLAPALFEDTGYNYETLAWRPSSQLFARENKSIKKILERENYPNKTKLLSYSKIDIDEEQIKDAVENRNEAELANLKHVHFEFLVPMSLSCFHQATRQRTWNQSVESIYDAAKRRETIIPPKVKKYDMTDEYNEQNEKMFELYESLIEYGIKEREAVGVLPHSLKIYDLIHVDGWNAIHSIGKRTCVEAQWEIRGIANKMSSEIKKLMPELGKYSEPQCIIYGKCPERVPCGYLEAYNKKHGIKSHTP